MLRQVWITSRDGEMCQKCRTVLVLGALSPFVQRQLFYIQKSSQAVCPSVFIAEAVFFKDCIVTVCARLSQVGFACLVPYVRPQESSEHAGAKVETVQCVNVWSVT